MEWRDLNGKIANCSCFITPEEVDGIRDKSPYIYTQGIVLILQLDRDQK